MRKPLSVDDVPRYVPGDTWLSVDPVEGRGLALRGYSYAPSDVDTPGVASSLIVVYLDGATEMTRRVAGRTETTTVSPGRISLLRRKNEVVWSWRQPIRVLHIYLSASLLEDVAERVFPGSGRDVELRNALGVEDRILHRIGLELADGDALAGPGADLYMAALTQQICIHVLRRHVERPRSAFPSGAGLSRRQSQRVLEVIEEAPHGRISLARLAAEAGVSEGHFIRLFKARFGVAPHRFLVQQRLYRTKELLRSGDLPLAEIAVGAGFSDQSHFTRVFKREFHTTPSAWRRAR